MRSIRNLINDLVIHFIAKRQAARLWCATRQVDNEKNIKFLCCPACAGQSFYAANNRS